MYLWNARRLALALRAGRVSERQKAQYLIAGSVISGLGVSAGLRALGSAATALPFLASLLVTVAGLRACQGANQRGDDTAFVERVGLPGGPGDRALAGALLGRVAGRGADR